MKRIHYFQNQFSLLHGKITSNSWTKSDSKMSLDKNEAIKNFLWTLFWLEKSQAQTVRGKHDVHGDPNACQNVVYKTGEIFANEILVSKID